MSKFIGYTIGLEANRNSQIGKMVKVSFERDENGFIRLKAVSGRNLEAMKGHATVSAEQFQERPQDAYDGSVEARWALNQCGWTLMTDDAAQ